MKEGGTLYVEYADFSGNAAGAVVNAGTMVIQNSKFLTAADTIENTGVLTFSGTNTINAGVTGNGTFTVADGASFVFKNTDAITVDKALAGAETLTFAGTTAAGVVGVTFNNATAEDFANKNIVVDCGDQYAQITLSKVIAGAENMTIIGTTGIVRLGNAEAADFANMTVTFANTGNLTINKAITGAKEIILQGGPVDFSGAEASDFANTNITIDLGDEKADLTLNKVLAGAKSMTITGSTGVVRFNEAVASDSANMTVTFANTGNLTTNKVITGAKTIILQGGYVEFYGTAAADFAGKNVIVKSVGTVNLHKSIVGTTSLTFNTDALATVYFDKEAVASDFADMTVTFANTQKLVIGSKAIAGAKMMILQGEYVEFYGTVAADFANTDVVVASDGEVVLFSSVSGAKSLTISGGATTVSFSDTDAATSGITNTHVTFENTQALFVNKAFSGAASLTFRGANVTINANDATLFENTDAIFENENDLTVNGALIGVKSLTFKGDGKVTFNGTDNTYSKGITISALNLADWFNDPLAEVKLATGADFTGATVSVTDTKGTEDTADDELKSLADGGKVVVGGVSYTVTADADGLSMSRTRTTINPDLTGDDAATRAGNFATAAKKAADAGELIVLGDDGFDAKSTMLYTSGASMVVKNLTHGKRLYGGSLDALSGTAATLNGDLTISGKNIAVGFVYGGGFLTGAATVSGTFTSKVHVAAGTTFAGAAALLGGSHINSTSAAVSINADSSLTIDSADVALSGESFVCGGHGCYTTTTISGSSSLTISAGTYNALVAGGSVLYVDGNKATLTQDGSTSLTITGGTFTENIYGGNIYLFTAEENKGTETQTTISGASTVTIDCTGDTEININKNIFAGSNGNGSAASSKVTFIGKGTGDALTIGGYVSGDSSGRRGDMEKVETEENYTYDYYIKGGREVLFRNFDGALTTEGLYDFDKFSFENAQVDLGSAGLNSAGETWNFSNGSSVAWNAELNFGGDSMILGKAGEELTGNTWEVFTGLDDIKEFDGMTSVSIFGKEAELLDGSWKTADFELTISGDTGNYSLIVSKLA